MSIKKGMGRLGWIAMLTILTGLLPLPNFGFCVQAAESKLDLEQILDHMEIRYTGKSFTAQFIQESSVKAMEITDFASGKMFVRYPGKMRWEYEKPERQVMITDGRRLWIYRPAENQVMTGRAPEIIVEILSPSSAKRDEVYKFDIYEQEKVRYYILVYPDDLRAKVYKLDGKAYDKQGDFSRESYRFEETTCNVTLDFERVFKRFRK